MDLIFYGAVAVLVLVGYLTVEGILGVRRIPNLQQVTSLPADPQLPLVSIIIPALNEAEHIQAALTSVLALSYPCLEIIVLDDRSTDATPAILDRLARHYSRLRVFHIRELPEGWLGKTHALQLGAEQARGRFLLFTDADVRMAPDTLNRAVARMEQQQLDHLCLLFHPLLPTSLLAMLVVDSLFGLFSFLKPWLAADAESPYFFGIGAFNLVRKTLYQQINGHHSIRLCPVDDVLLGRLLKEAGGRQECLNGRDLISVPWYGSVAEMMQGLRKNLYAVIDYRFSRLVLASLVILCCTILPFWGLLLAGTPGRLVCLAVLLFTGLSQAVAAHTLGVPISCLRWFLFTPYIKLYMMWQAVLVTLFRGGIVWRGTFYPLSALKKSITPLWPW
jgi:glycosyltransferase involved in cell wall biosynthesis